MPLNGFAERLGQGKTGESAIACFWRSRNNCVLPVYEKEINEGKGPRLFGPSGEHIAPDMLVLPVVEWVEAKNKKVWTWHRRTQKWTTGIDLNHYQGYQETQRESGRRVWLSFLHNCSQPDRRDVAQGCPQICPTGLFVGSLDYLVRNENHRHDNWGRHGMVYWAAESLKKIATVQEVEQATDRYLGDVAERARLS